MPMVGVPTGSTVKEENTSKTYLLLCFTCMLSISQKALETLPEDGNVMPKHVGATIHN
jgi:hypothetical protein